MATLTVQPDEIRYLEVVPTMGAATARVRVDEANASDRRFLKHCATAPVVFEP